MDNQKNLLLAVVLSVVILVGFDFFFKTEKKQLPENINTNETILTDQSKAKAGDENVPTINIESTEQNKVKEKTTQ